MKKFNSRKWYSMSNLGQSKVAKGAFLGSALLGLSMGALGCSASAPAAQTDFGAPVDLLGASLGDTTDVLVGLEATPANSLITKYGVDDFSSRWGYDLEDSNYIFTLADTSVFGADIPSNIFNLAEHIVETTFLYGVDQDWKNIGDFGEQNVRRSTPADSAWTGTVDTVWTGDYGNSVYTNAVNSWGSLIVENNPDWEKNRTVVVPESVYAIGSEDSTFMHLPQIWKDAARANSEFSLEEIVETPITSITIDSSEVPSSSSESFKIFDIELISAERLPEENGSQERIVRSYPFNFSATPFYSNYSMGSHGKIKPSETNITTEMVGIDLGVGYDFGNGTNLNTTFGLANGETDISGGNGSFNSSLARFGLDGYTKFGQSNLGLHAGFDYVSEKHDGIANQSLSYPQTRLGLTYGNDDLSVEVGARSSGDRFINNADILLGGNDRQGILEGFVSGKFLVGPVDFSGWYGRSDVNHDYNGLNVNGPWDRFGASVGSNNGSWNYGLEVDHSFGDWKVTYQGVTTKTLEPKQTRVGFYLTKDLGGD